MLQAHIEAQSIIINSFTKEASFLQKIMKNIKLNVNTNQTVTNVWSKEQTWTINSTQPTLLSTTFTINVTKVKTTLLL